MHLGVQMNVKPNLTLDAHIDLLISNLSRISGFW